jgi:hypothetical protein
MTSDRLAVELERAEALVSRAWPGIDLERCDANPPFADLGASAGFGFTRDDPRLRASVYVFDRWGGGQQPGAMLVEMVDGDRYQAAYAVNGALMVFGVVDADSDGGADGLDQLIAAFAGLE